MFERGAGAVLSRLEALTEQPRRRHGEAAFWGSSPRLLDSAVSRFYYWASAARWGHRAASEEHLAPFLAGLEQLRRPRAVLDVGTGTGASAAAAAKRFPEARVHAVDWSGRMIRLARQEHQLPNLTFHQAEHNELPFADASFDLACMLNATPRPWELRRVTTPGAEVLVVNSFFELPGTAWFERWDALGYERTATGHEGAGHWQLFVKREPTESTVAEISS